MALADGAGVSVGAVTQLLATRHRQQASNEERKAVILEALYDPD